MRRHQPTIPYTQSFLQQHVSGDLIHVERVYRRILDAQLPPAHRDVVVSLGTITQQRVGTNVWFEIDEGGEQFRSVRDAIAELEDRAQPREPDWAREDQS